MFVCGWPRGLMDKASDFGSEDWGFESLRGRVFFFLKIPITEKISSKYVELSRLSNKNSSSLSGRLCLKSDLCLYYKKNVNVTRVFPVWVNRNLLQGKRRYVVWNSHQTTKFPFSYRVFILRQRGKVTMPPEKMRCFKSIGGFSLASFKKIKRAIFIAAKSVSLSHETLFFPNFHPRENVAPFSWPWVSHE